MDEELLAKQMPQSLEAEQAVLGSILIDSRCVADVIGIVRPEDFYLRQNREIFESIYTMFNFSQTIDPVTVLDKMRELGYYQDNSREYVLQLMEITPTAANAVRYASIVRDKAMLRGLATAATEISETVYNQVGTPAEMLESAEKKIYALRKGERGDSLEHIGTILHKVFDHLTELSQSDSAIPGLSTCLRDLDAKINGLNKSDLLLVAARPAMGKTAFVLSMAKNMAIDHNSPVAIFSLEMSNQELVQRLVINVSEIPGEKIKRGDLSNAEWKQLQTRIECLESAPIYIDDTANMSISELCSKARRLSSERGIKCIIIDYLQLMNASGMSYGSREQEVSIISRSLKGLAKELNIPVIALSQLNRGVEQRSRDDKTPQLSDLRESGAIEQDADMVVFIHRPEYYGITTDKEGNSNEGVAEIIIAKHRSGSVGTVRLRFTKELIKFSNIDFSGSNNMDFGSRKNNTIEQYQSSPEVYASSSMPQADSGDPF